MGASQLEAGFPLNPATFQSDNFGLDYCASVAEPEKTDPMIRLSRVFGIRPPFLWSHYQKSICSHFCSSLPLFCFLQLPPKTPSTFSSLSYLAVLIPVTINGSFLSRGFLLSCFFPSIRFLFYHVFDDFGTHLIILYRFNPFL